MTRIWEEVVIETPCRYAGHDAGTCGILHGPAIIHHGHRGQDCLYEWDWNAGMLVARDSLRADPDRLVTALLWPDGTIKSYIVAEDS